MTHEPLLTCFTKAALKHARARGIPARLVPLGKWEKEELAPIRVPPENVVVQLAALTCPLGAVPPEKPGGTGVPPHIRESSSTPEEATAKAHTPFARQEASSGGTPPPDASKPKRKTKKTSTGRAANGPACISCYYYQALYRDDCLYSYGACKARDNLTIQAVNRNPCALYQFFS